jgi:hypothetical protein
MVFLPIIVVTKNDDTKCVCTIMQHKFTKKYSFVNITKGHICSCEFNTQEEAVKDLCNKCDNNEIAHFILYRNVPIAKIIQYQVEEVVDRTMGCMRN